MNTEERGARNSDEEERTGIIASGLKNRVCNAPLFVDAPLIVRLA